MQKPLGQYTSAYRRHAARAKNPSLLSPRAQRDAHLAPKIEAVWNANFQVYGADKVWKQMNREGVTVARCTVERLMKRMALQGVTRGKVVRTTVPDANAPCPLDRVNRHFKADRPDQLWVSDFTVTHGKGLVVGARTFPGNPYDGHTLAA